MEEQKWEFNWRENHGNVLTLLSYFPKRIAIFSILFANIFHSTNYSVTRHSTSYIFGSSNNSFQFNDIQGVSKFANSAYRAL
jgi:hypothetical protein